jgi:hypothetical protein
MDNDIRVVTDKEVYLLASPVISKSETEIVFRNWLRTGGLTGPEITDAIAIVSIEDIYLPMSVTSVESWGNWRLLHGSFQKREFDRDQRQYERDFLAYQAEEKKHQAARERGEHYALPQAPRSPDREDYYEYFPDSGEYTTSFKGILRAFGDEALGRAKGSLNDVAVSLDQLLRHGFPAAEAASAAPAPINRDVLNRLVDEYVSDRGIDWVKDQAKKYEKARKLEISDVHYRRECNIVFLPVRLIEYAFAGATYTAISDPIRNEYLLGTPPSPVKAVAPPVSASKNMKLISMAAAAVVLLIVASVALLKLTGKHEPSSTAQAPASTSVSTTPPPQSPAAAAAPAPTNTANDQAAAQAAAAKQAAAQRAAAQQAAAAAQAAQEAAAAQAAQAAAAAQAAQAAAAAQAEQEAAAAQAAQQAAAAEAAHEAAQAKAEQEAAAVKAAKEAAAAKAAQEAATARAEQEAAAAKAAQVAAAAKAAQAAQAAAASAAVVSPDNSANDLTAAANASTAAPPAATPAMAKAKPEKAAARTEAAPTPVPAPSGPAAAPTGLTGKAYEEFAAGQLRLPTTGAAPVTSTAVADNLSAAAQKHDAQTLSKTTAQTAAGNDLGYYYLGVAAQDSGNTAAARTYYQLSLQHSETNNPPSVCSPSHRATYQPQLCHGIVLPSRAARALASLPSS